MILLCQRIMNAWPCLSVSDWSRNKSKCYKQTSKHSSVLQFSQYKRHQVLQLIVSQHSPIIHVHNRSIICSFPVETCYAACAYLLPATIISTTATDITQNLS